MTVLPQIVLSTKYVEAGEALLHGVAASQDYMPLAGVLFAHLSRAGAGWLPALFLSAVMALAFSAGCLLQSLPCGLLSAALCPCLFIFGDALLFPFHCVYALFILLVGGVAVWRAENDSLWSDLALSAAVGISLLYRSPLFLFPVVLAALEWRRMGAQRALILLLVPYAFLIPWIAMNLRLAHKLMIFEAGTANTNIATGALGMLHTVEGDPGRLVPHGSVLGWAIGQILFHPLRYAWAVLSRLVYAASAHPLLSAAAALAVWRSWAKPGFRAAGMLVLYFVAIHCLMTVKDAYFIPVWPLVAVLAASLVFPSSENPAAHRFSSRVVLGALGLALLLSFETLAAVCRYGRPFRAVDESMLAAHPRDAWLRATAARLKLKEGDVDGAARDFSAGLALRPDDDELRRQLAVALALKGRPSAALASVPCPPFLSEKEMDCHLEKAAIWSALKDERHLKAELLLARKTEFQKGIDPSHYRTALDRDVARRFLAGDDSEFLAQADLALAELPPAARAGMSAQVRRLASAK